MSTSSQTPYQRKAGATASQTFFEYVTGPPAEALLSQSGILDTPPSDQLIVFDDACGTGIIAALLYESAALEGRTLHVTCGDIVPSMVEAVKQRIEKERWKGAEANLIDAQDTKLPSVYTHAFFNFGPKLVQKPEVTIAECHRVLIPRGVVGFSAWNHYGWYEWLKLAVSRVSGAPPLPSLDEIFQAHGAWDEPSWVRQKLADLGFVNVKVEHVDFKVRMDNPSIFIRGFMPLIPMGLKRWDEKDRNQYLPLIVKELEKVLVEQYGEDGAFDMGMIAVISTASKP
ncbi:hypothetical protein FRB97_004910 [Tulasnella sp. 331]|nr:hypothetical protein FRB97_004910 [Tulasnella sp. 331]